MRLSLSAQHTQTTLVEPCDLPAGRLRCHRARGGPSWPTEPDDDLVGDNYARRALTGEADAFHTPSLIGGDLC